MLLRPGEVGPALATVKRALDVPSEEFARRVVPLREQGGGLGEDEARGILDGLPGILATAVEQGLGVIGLCATVGDLPDE